MVPKKDSESQYPGIFLFTGPNRLMRPVLNLALNKTELIGTFEQVYLEICLKLNEAYEGVSIIIIMSINSNNNNNSFFQQLTMSHFVLAHDSQRIISHNIFK